MIRSLKIFTIILFFISCDTGEKKSEARKTGVPKWIEILEPDHDTLPNGQRLMDNRDSSLSMYYKEVVGSDTLKEGHITSYGIDDSTKYFYLRKGDTLHLLNQVPIYTSTWGLGTLEKDFDNFFITNIDNGNGVPGTYQVFDKSTAKNILGEKVDAWDFTFFGDTLYFLYDNYINGDGPDSIFLFNVKSGARQGFKLPKENPNDVIYYDIKKLSKNSLTIGRREHYTDEEKLIKYNR